MINFNKVRPADLWYVIGYITTDGYLSKDGRHINITSKDREHLYKIRNALGLKNIIGNKSRVFSGEKIFSQLQFGDVKFYRFLLGLGLTSKKSLTLGSLDINSSFFVDFLRGVIDGDGNISTWIHRTNYNRQWCLRIYSASKIFIEWLNIRVVREFEVKGRLYSNKAASRHNFIYHIKFGKSAAIKILGRTYYEGSLSLKRKLLQVQLCLQEGHENGKLYT